MCPREDNVSLAGYGESS